MIRDRSSSDRTRASFPLFQMIYNDLKEEDRMGTVPSASARSLICKKIREMDDYHMELVYALIRCYHLQIDQRPIFETPYDMKKTKTMHFRFDMEDLPDPLVLIIHRFVEMYERKKSEPAPHDNDSS